MRVNREISSFKKIKRGIRCGLSPDLFFHCREIILQNLGGYPGIKEGGHNVNYLRYAYGTVLIAENEEDLLKLLHTVEDESSGKGLELNSRKTEVIFVSRNSECPQMNIFINGNKVKQRSQFKYLGSLILSDGRNKNSASKKKSFQRLKPIHVHFYLHRKKRPRELYMY